MLLTTANNLGLEELKQVCQEILDQHAKEQEQQQNILTVAPPPRRKIVKTPTSTTRKRNMLERIPTSEQIPIVLNVDDVVGGKKERIQTKIKPEAEEEEESVEVGGDEENAVPPPEGVVMETGIEMNVAKEEKKEESFYRCNKCNKDLPYGTSLFRHELRHKMLGHLKKGKKGAWQCSKCPKKFPTKNSRNCHERNHNKQPRFSCPHCDQCFFFEFVRDKHIIKNHADVDPDITTTKMPCTVPNCGKVFPTEALLRTHRSRKHGIKEESGRPDKPQPCDVCGKEVLWLNEHKKSVHPELMGEVRGSFECTECGKVLKYASSLKRHMYIHQDGGSVNCPHCEKTFSHPSSLWSHFPSCAKIPPEEKVLLKTPPKKYKRKPKNLACEICNKSFTNLRNYRYVAEW